MQSHKNPFPPQDMRIGFPVFAKIHRMAIDSYSLDSFKTYQCIPLALSYPLRQVLFLNLSVSLRYLLFVDDKRAIYACLGGQRPVSDDGASLESNHHVNEQPCDEIYQSAGKQKT